MSSEGVVAHLRQVFEQSPTLCAFLRTNPDLVNRWTVLTSVASTEMRCTTIVLEGDRVLAVDHTARDALSVRVVLDGLTDMARRFGSPDIRNAQSRILSDQSTPGATLQSEAR